VIKVHPWELEQMAAVGRRDAEAMASGRRQTDRPDRTARIEQLSAAWRWRAGASLASLGARLSGLDLQVATEPWQRPC
jgi:hypothetical protein